MKNTPALSLAEKIKLIRKAKGLSIENLAHAANVNISTISRIENGTMQYSDEMLDAIVKYMEIENAPFTEHEIEIYKSRLWLINELITEVRTAEARAAYSAIFPINMLPYEHDLSLIYSMTEARILFMEGNMQAAIDKVIAADTCLEGASNEALILYHRNRGNVYQLYNELENTLIQYQLAANIESDVLPVEANTYFNIGFYYYSLGKPSLAMQFLERAKMHYHHDRTHEMMAHIDNGLATCHLIMGQYSKAKKLLHKGLALAKSVSSDGEAIGQPLLNLGYAYICEGDAKTGLQYTEQSLEHIKEGDESYCQVLYNKAYALILMKKYDSANEVITLGKSLSKEGDILAVGFEALESIIALQSPQKDNAAAEYISNVAIPHFRGGGATRHGALFLCDMLEAYYKKHRNTKMAMATAVIARDIYKELFIGDVE